MEHICLLFALSKDIRALANTTKPHNSLIIARSHMLWQ